jgi:TolA-binding protein
MRGMFRFVVLLAVVSLAGCAGMAFRSAAETDTIVAYEKFLADHATSENAPEAKRRLDELYFQKAEKDGSIRAYQDYLRNRPDSALVPEAKQRIDKIRFGRAEQIGTVQAYDTFVKEHSESSFAAEAKRRADELDFKAVERTNWAHVYADYITRRPDSALVPEAKRRIDDLEFRAAEVKGTIAAYEEYVAQRPESARVTEARQRIEQMSDAEDWAGARDSNVVDAYDRFIARHPASSHVPEATERKAELEKYRKGWEALSHGPTLKRFEDYLRQNPNSPYAENATSIIQDMKGRHIAELAEKKIIEVEPKGGGIEWVNIRLRTKTPYPVKVLIPVGTFFVSAQESAQNMVATGGRELVLSSGQWASVSVPAACANRPKDIPDSEDTFSVVRSPHQEELARLMPALAKAGADTATTQAAVWIVTDDASYGDLGILVASYNGMPGGRIIDEEEAALAMKICDQAGIDITGKQIWSDREEILEGIGPGPVRTWLRKRAGMK